MRRGGGKMCSHESKEWYEKKAKCEKGRAVELNGQGCIILKKKRRIKEGVVGG